MFRMAGYCPDPEEAAVLREAMRCAIAFRGSEECNIDLYCLFSDFQHTLDALREPSLCCMDVSDQGALDAAIGLRERFPGMRLLLLAPRDMLPTRYLRPSIMPSALLLKPFCAAEARVAAQELMLAVMRDDLRAGGEAFSITTRKEQIRLSYSDIRYFEAQGRKIFVCAGGREYAFYATLENLQETLPGEFVRCHKGYIVNTAYVCEASFPRGELTLAGGYIVPVSRSYRKLFRSLQL